MYLLGNHKKQIMTEELSLGQIINKVILFFIDFRKLIISFTIKYSNTLPLSLDLLICCFLDFHQQVSQFNKQ